MDNLIRVKNTYKLPYTIRAGWTSYVVPTSIIFGPLSLVAVLVAFKSPSHAQSFLLPDLIIFGSLTFFLIWIASFKIVLNSDSISYKTLFSKGLQVKFSEIKKVEIDIGMHSSRSKQSGRQKSYYSLNIFTHSPKQHLSINMKPFSKRDLAILIDAIMVANPSVELDRLSRNLYEGDFKPIVSQSIRKFWQFALWWFLVFLVMGL